MSKIITPKKPDLSCHSTTIKPSQCKWKSIVNPYPKDNWSQKRNGLEVYTRSISTDKSEECTYVSHALPKELSEGLWSGIWHIIFVSILDLDDQHRSDFLPLYLFHTVMCRSQCSSFSWQSTCSITNNKDLHWFDWWLLQSKVHKPNTSLKVVKRKNKILSCFNYWLKKTPLHELDKNNKAWF